mgnify:CR=1 FL=1
MNKFPKKAIWHNQDFDMPVTIVAIYGEHNGIVYYKSETGTGIPKHELEFENAWKRLINWLTSQ